MAKSPVGMRNVSTRKTLKRPGLFLPMLVDTAGLTVLHISQLPFPQLLSWSFLHQPVQESNLGPTRWHME